MLCLVYTVARLQFSTDKNDLVSGQESYRREFLQFKEEFAPRDNMFVLVESDDPAKSRDFVGRLAARLQSDGRFTNVYFRAGLDVLGSKSLLFLPEPTLARLDRVLGSHQDLIRALSQSTNLETLFGSVNRQFRLLSRSRTAGSDTEALTRRLITLKLVVDQASESIVSLQPPRSPDMVSLFVSAQKGTFQDGYLSFGEGRIHVVIAQPRTSRLEKAAVRQLKRLIDETRPMVPGVNVEVTGEAILRGDEMDQARKDTEMAALISLALTALVFIATCRAVMRPLLATLCLLIGLCYTLGFATLAVGSLNVLSITLVPILIGLAIDYGVHLIFRYEEQIGEGHSPDYAIRTALGFTGIGIVTSGLTIAASFYLMALTDFRGIREMGLIAGSGILVCLVPMLTLLPLLLVRTDKGRRPSPVISRIGRERRGRIEQLYLKHPWWVLVLGAVFTVLMIVQTFKVHFDYNLLDLQSRASPAVRMQKKLIQSGSHSLLYCAVIANSLPQAMEWERRIERLPSVARVVSLVKFLTEDQKSKLALIQSIQRQLAGIPVPGLDTRPVEVSDLNQTLYSLGGYLGRAIDSLQSSGTNEVAVGRLRSLRTSVTRLQHLTATDLPSTVERLSDFQRGLYSSFRETLAMVSLQDYSKRLRQDDVPDDLRGLFIGHSGRYLLQVYPKGDVWQRKQQQEFIRQLRSVAPNVTGSPVLFYEYTTRLKRNVEKAAVAAGTIVAVLLLLHFGRLSCALLALSPVLFGFCWMLGIMGCLDISFNPVNIMSLVLVIGIGVANGVHILNRFIEEPQPVILAKSTGKAVLVSALSTIVGFGSLMVAKHQGIASLGAVMSIGAGMCTAASLALLPAALKVLGNMGWRPRR